MAPAREPSDLPQLPPAAETDAELDALISDLASHRRQFAERLKNAKDTDEEFRVKQELWEAERKVVQAEKERIKPDPALVAQADRLAAIEAMLPSQAEIEERAAQLKADEARIRASLAGVSPTRGAIGEGNSRVIPQAVKIAVALRDQGRCVECGADEDLQYDHKVPWSRGGSSTVNNIQLLCGSCNRRKGANDHPA